MMDEAEIGLRGEGLTWDVVHKAFCWYDLSKDFIREMVEQNQLYKTQLQHQLLMDFHGYSIHASMFYKNMMAYLDLGLAEQEQLEYYRDKIYSMYRERADLEYNSRTVHSLVDNSGRVLDQIVY